MKNKYVSPIFSYNIVVHAQNKINQSFNIYFKSVGILDAFKC